jgi:hypothetical protein
MNIKSIQTTQIEPATLRPPERSYSKVDAGMGFSLEVTPRVSLGSSASINATHTPVVQAQALVNQISYIKEQLDKILVDFPPFFPPGSYQRADLIKGVRNIQNEVEQSSVPSDTKKDIPSQKLAEEATDHDISAVLDKLLVFRDEIAKKLPEMAESLEPGTVVTVKV